jgi:hypothetical protein
MGKQKNRLTATQPHYHFARISPGPPAATKLNSQQAHLPCTYLPCTTCPPGLPTTPSDQVRPTYPVPPAQLPYTSTYPTPPVRRRPRRPSPADLPCTSAATAQSNGRVLRASLPYTHPVAGRFPPRGGRPPARTTKSSRATLHPLPTPPTRPRLAGRTLGKSRRRTAYPQQIVTTRLLYCLQDRFAQLSRLQRI